MAADLGAVPATTRQPRHGLSGVFDAEVAPLFEAYWQAALEPYWDSMKLTLQMEAQRRSETLVSRGWVAMLGSIDPRLRWRAPQLASPHQEEIDYAGDVRRLRLVPLMFGGALTLFTAIPIGTTSLSYALPAGHARRSLQGIREQAAEQHDPLTILLGARRAGILRHLQRRPPRRWCRQRWASRQARRRNTFAHSWPSERDVASAGGTRCSTNSTERASS